MVDDQRLRPSERLRKRNDFTRVYDAKRHAADSGMVVHVAENGLPWSRLGMSVSKRIGTAAHRNLVRRRIREAFRRNKAALPKGYDIICSPRTGADRSYAAMESSLRTLVVKAVRRFQPSRERKSPPAS